MPFPKINLIILLKNLQSTYPLIYPLQPLLQLLSHLIINHLVVFLFLLFLFNFLQIKSSLKLIVLSYFR